MLDTGCWVLGTGYWVLGIGYWVLGIGCWVLGTGPSSFVRIVRPEKRTAECRMLNVEGWNHFAQSFL
jgi:hypothetical protein